jgi:hypothetical protein
VILPGCFELFIGASLAEGEEVLIQLVLGEVKVVILGFEYDKVHVVTQ